MARNLVFDVKLLPYGIFLHRQPIRKACEIFIAQNEQLLWSAHFLVCDSDECGILFHCPCGHPPDYCASFQPSSWPNAPVHPHRESLQFVNTMRGDQFNKAVYAQLPVTHGHKVKSDEDSRSSQSSKCGLPCAWVSDDRMYLRAEASLDIIIGANTVALSSKASDRDDAVGSTKT